MFNRRRVVIGLVLLALAAGSWWLTHKAEQPALEDAARARGTPDYTIEDFIARSMNEQGMPKYVLSAQRLLHYPTDNTAHLVQPVLVQHLRDGVQVTTRADAGVMPGDWREIVMTGNVHVQRAADGKSTGGEVLAERLRVELDRP